MARGFPKYASRAEMAALILAIGKYDTMQLSRDKVMIGWQDVKFGEHIVNELKAMYKQLKCEYGEGV